MPIGYVLINTEAGHSESVLETLKKVDVVEEAYLVYGTYDVVIKIKTDTMDKLRDTIVNMRLSGEVQTTQTLVVMNET